MATTLLQLRTIARRFIDETTAGTFSDADITAYVNAAQLSTWMQLCEVDPSFGLRESTVTLVQAQTEYAYPSDILGRNVKSLYAYETATAATWKRVYQKSFETVINEGVIQTSYPNCYVPMDGYFKIGPPPSAAGWKLRMVYTRVPTTLSSDNANMDSDDVFAELIGVRAAIRALERTGVDLSLLEKREVRLISQSLGAVQPDDLRHAEMVWEY